ncbi:MAG: hypothetical protein WA609_09955 [Terriglobales bacterium]
MSAVDIVLESLLMETAPKPASEKTPSGAKPAVVLYCPVCAVEVTDPLTCGDCSAVICRRCGTPLESSDDLAMG